MLWPANLRRQFIQIKKTIDIPEIFIFLTKLIGNFQVMTRSFSLRFALSAFSIGDACSAPVGLQIKLKLSVGANDSQEQTSFVVKS